MAVGAALVAALTGCTSSIGGEAIPADPQLDTGGYAVGPREVPERTGTDAIVQMNIVLSDYVVLPPDLDAKFDWYAPRPYPSLAGAASRNNVLGGPIGDAVAPGQKAGVIGAFREARADGAPTMAVFVMRYSSETEAANAYNGARALMPRGRELGPGVVEGPTPTSFAPGLAFWSRHADYVLAAVTRDVDRPRAEALAAAWFERQPARLDQVPFKAWQMPPADKDGIMRYTRLDEVGEPIMAFVSGYFSNRALGIVGDGRWSSGLRTRTTFQIELIGASGRNQVMRAASPNFAADWVANQAKTFGAPGADDGGRVEERIRGLPQSVCVSRVAQLLQQTNRVFACQVPRGRYIAVAFSSTLAQAQQSTAAGYLTLPQA
ncbi:Lipoprotein [Tsukamurella hominis]